MSCLIQAVTASLVLLSPVWALADTILGPSGSGGGGPQAADFTSSARLVAAALGKNPAQTDATFEVPGFGSLYTGAIDSTEVICATGALLESMKKNKQYAYFDGVNTINLYCEKYGDMERAGMHKYVVVFHEYMRKLHLENSDYRLSSRLPLLFVVPGDTKRAIEAFCEGGSRDKFQLETYIAQMLAEKSIESYGAKMLREAAVNGIKFPDANAREIATFLGWNKNDQYPWAVDVTCMSKDRIFVDFNDTSKNDRSVLELDGLAGAVLHIGKAYTIPRGRASVVMQNGKILKHGKDSRPYCRFAHDTDPKRNVTVEARDVMSSRISAFRGERSANTQAGYGVNFSVVNQKNVTDVYVWLPGDAGTVKDLRSALKSCGGSLVNLADLVPASI